MSDLYCFKCQKPLGFFDKKLKFTNTIDNIDLEIYSCSKCDKPTKNDWKNISALVRNQLKNSVKEASNLVAIDQVKEALETGAYCVYTSTELKELGFSTKQIKKVEENNKLIKKQMH